MRRPNLSVTAIAGTLALLGCSKRAADGAGPEQVAAPVSSATATAAARELPPPTASASASGATPKPGATKKDMNGNASCGAGNCATDPKKK